MTTERDFNRFVNSLMDDLVHNKLFPVLSRSKFIYQIDFNPQFECDYAQVEKILTKHLGTLRKYSVSKEQEIRDNDTISIKFYVHEKDDTTYCQGFSCTFSVSQKTSIEQLMQFFPLFEFSEISKALKHLDLNTSESVRIRIVDFKFR